MTARSLRLAFLFFLGSPAAACSAPTPPLPSAAGVDAGAASAPGTTAGGDTSGIGPAPDAGGAADGGAVAVSRSTGCGKPARDPSGGVQVTLQAGADGGGARSYYLSIPKGYDANKAYRLIVGYPGTNWTGKMIQPYLDLESHASGDEIFAYPDPEWHDFTGWGNLGGWLLGPNAAPANGDDDLVFTAALLDDLEASYCVDTSREFATGHSWGGDMAQVVSCFLGDRFRASVPVAANRPYWFHRSDGTTESCKGKTAVWTMFGSGDDHFTEQSYPGQFGDECRDFWLAEAKCSAKDAGTLLPYGSGTECTDYAGCDRTTRYCLYGPATAHQRPDYYPQAAMEYFHSF